MFRTPIVRTSPSTRSRSCPSRARITSVAYLDGGIALGAAKSACSRLCGLRRRCWHCWCCCVMGAPSRTARTHRRCAPAPRARLPCARQLSGEALHYRCARLDERARCCSCEPVHIRSRARGACRRPATRRPPTSSAWRAPGKPRMFAPGGEASAASSRAASGLCGALCCRVPLGPRGARRRCGARATATRRARRRGARGAAARAATRRQSLRPGLARAGGVVSDLRNYG